MEVAESLGSAMAELIVAADYDARYIPLFRKLAWTIANRADVARHVHHLLDLLVPDHPQKGGA